MSLIYQNNKKAIRVFSDELALAVATYKADPNNYTIFAKSTGLSEVVLDKMFEVNTDRLPNIFKYLYYEKRIVDSGHSNTRGGRDKSSLLMNREFSISSNGNLEIRLIQRLLSSSINC